MVGKKIVSSYLHLRQLCLHLGGEIRRVLDLVAEVPLPPPPVGDGDRDEDGVEGDGGGRGQEGDAGQRGDQQGQGVHAAAAVCKEGHMGRVSTTQ